MKLELCGSASFCSNGKLTCVWCKFLSLEVSCLISFTFLSLPLTHHPKNVYSNLCKYVIWAYNIHTCQDSPPCVLIRDEPQSPPFAITVIAWWCIVNYSLISINLGWRNFHEFGLPIRFSSLCSKTLGYCVLSNKSIVVGFPHAIWLDYAYPIF